jgi:hypothetical protein
MLISKSISGYLSSSSYPAVDPKLRPESFLRLCGIPLSKTEAVSLKIAQTQPLTIVHSVTEVVGDLVIEFLDSILSVIELSKLEFTWLCLVFNYVVKVNLSMKFVIRLQG